jgi:hypothetical protein
MAVAHTRYKFVAVSLLKRLRSGRFISTAVEVAVIKRPPNPEVVKKK